MTGYDYDLVGVVGSIAYSGMASLCLFWVVILTTRWIRTRRIAYGTLALLALSMCNSYMFLSLSTGLVKVISISLATVRMFSLLTLVIGIIFTVVYIRDQRRAEHDSRID